MRTINYSDHLERTIGNALDQHGIEFIHESENKDQRLDFYLPKSNVFIEVKQYHTDRVSEQMASKDNVIAIQGKLAVDLFIKLLSQ